jgi:hypothetical protein
MMLVALSGRREFFALAGWLRSQPINSLPSSPSADELSVFFRVIHRYYAAV